MTTETKQAPLMAGWAIAAGVGLVTTGVGHIVMELSLLQAAGVAAVLFLVVGIILGLPGRIQGAPNVMLRQMPGDDPTFVQPPRTMPSPPTPGPRTEPLEASASPLVQPVHMVSEGAPVATDVSELSRPPVLPGPRDGVGDNLQVIEGIGPKLEQLCHDLGFWHYDQIATWTDAEVAWVDMNLTGFKGRVTRDKWVRQARLIAEVGVDEFLRRAKTNDY